MNRGVILLFCVLVVAGCDVVNDRYDSVVDARNNRLFERGWLPDILPMSAKAISVSNNLDLNTSQGDFRFNVADYPAFRAQLSTQIPAQRPFSDWNNFVDGRASEGYTALTYSADRSIWVFLCNDTRGHCVYRMWQLRVG